MSAILHRTIKASIRASIKEINYSTKLAYLLKYNTYLSNFS